MANNENAKAPDSLSWGILAELQQNARLSITEIGKRVGLSAPAVAERIQKMEEQQIINSYGTSLDFDKLGLTVRAFILYKPTRINHTELIKLVDAIPEAIEWHTITGHYSVLLKVATFSSEQLALVIEHLEEFGETNTSLILSKNKRQKVIRKRGK